MPEQALLDAYCIMHATFSARLGEGSETLVSSRAQWEALVPRCQDSGTGTGFGTLARVGINRANANQVCIGGSCERCHACFGTFMYSFSFRLNKTFDPISAPRRNARLELQSISQCAPYIFRHLCS